jgi:hypothetical protein
MKIHKLFSDFLLGIAILTLGTGATPQGTKTSPGAQSGNNRSNSEDSLNPSKKPIQAVFFNCTFQPISIQSRPPLEKGLCPKELYFKKETVTLNVFYNTEVTGRKATKANLNILLGNSSLVHPPMLYSAENVQFSFSVGPFQYIQIQIDPSKFSIPEDISTKTTFVAHIQLLLFDVMQGSTVDNVNTLEFFNLLIEPGELVNEKGDVIPVVPPSSTPDIVVPQPKSPTVAEPPENEKGSQTASKTISQTENTPNPSNNSVAEPTPSATVITYDPNNLNKNSAVSSVCQFWWSILLLPL